MRYAVISLVMGALLACGKGRAPSDLIGEEQFVNVMVDVHLAEASVQHLRLSADSAKLVLADHYATIMDKHNIEHQQFTTSFEYYRQHPDELSKIYEKVIERLSALEVEWANKYE
jgi:hypothetical protein